ncbi:MAG: nucleotidyltransferase family protein, partial [Acidimicrobiales bacterium]
MTPPGGRSPMSWLIAQFVELGELEPPELDGAAFDSLRSACQQHRLMPLLADAFATGRLVVDDEARQMAVDDAVAAMGVAVGIEMAALRATAALEKAGVEYRITKGLATAHLDYENPALRQFADADILVRPSQFEGAVSALDAQEMKIKHAIRGSQWQAQHSY